MQWGAYELYTCSFIYCALRRKATTKPRVIILTTPHKDIFQWKKSIFYIEWNTFENAICKMRLFKMRNTPLFRPNLIKEGSERPKSTAPRPFSACSGWQQKTHKSVGRFPSQRAGNGENVPMSWRPLYFTRHYICIHNSHGHHVNNMS